MNKKERLRKLNKKTAVMTIAAVTAGALAVTGIYQLKGYVQDAEVYAKESFAGMKDIVKEHDEENPFTILDISPTRAIYPLAGTGNTYNLSTGTIGYLTGGQAPIEQDLKRILLSNTAFYDYEKRAELAENILPSGFDNSDFLTIAYEEIYGGTVDGIDERRGWIKLYDPVEADGPDASTVDKPTGHLQAYVEPVDQSAGEDGQYDYDGPEDFGAQETAEGLFKFSDSGEWCVTFEYDPDAVSGYVPSMLACDDLSSYSSTTGVYYLNDDGVYEYVGTKAQILGLKEENKKPSDGDKDKPDKDKEEKPEEGEKPEPGDGEGDNTGGDEGDGGNGDNTGGDEGEGEGGNTGGDEGDGGNGDNTGGEGDGGNGDNTGGDESDGGNGDNTSGGEGDGGNGDNTGGGEGSGDTSGDSGDSGSNGDSDSSGGSSESSDSPDESASADVAAAAVKWHRLVAENGDQGNDSGTDSQDNSQSNDPGSDDDGSGSGSDNDQSNGPGSDDDGSGSGQDNSQNDDPGSGGDGAGNSQDNSQSSDPGSSSDDPDSSDNSDDDDDSDEGKPQNAGDKYYVLKFEYVSNPSDETKLYQIMNKEKAPDWDGAVMPYDRYDIDGSVEGAEDEALDGDETAEYAVSPGGSDLPVFKYVGTGGKYNLKAAYKADEDYDNSHEIIVENAPVYFRCCKGNNWLEKYVFNALEDGDNYYDQFTIEVVSVTAEEVTPDMVKEADLIYLESGIGVFINGGASLETIGPDNGGMEDISDASVLQIIKDAVTDLKPVIVDYDIIADKEKYPDSNYQNMARVFLKEDLAGYYYSMGEDNLLDDLFMGLDSDDFEDNKDNDCNYVNQNIYMVNGETPLVSEDFPKSFDDDEAKRGFKEVLLAIRAENSTMLDKEDDWLEEEVSKARAIAYIINYSVGMIGDYRDVSILELQPTANLDSDLHVEVNDERKTTTLYWKKKDSKENGQQIFRSTKVVEVTDTIKSVAEFNGEWEDINSVYDMVFIGLDGQRLNHEGRDEHTVYNDGDLNGLVYHTGDTVSGRDQRYDPNDITEQKKEALLDYLRAGYPIVVENNCIKVKKSDGKEYRSVNTSYIADNTQMYAFLEEALEHYGDYLYTVRDVRGNPDFRAQLNVVKPRIEYAEETDSVQYMTFTPERDYEGTIQYKVTGNRDKDSGNSEEDNAYRNSTTLRFYLDLNYDGFFSPSEELAPSEDTGGYSNEEGQIRVRIAGVEAGMIPWKLEVSDADNGYRRDMLTGYFQIAGQAQLPVNVLQILDDKDKETANLQKNFEDIKNSTLRHYLESAENAVNVKYEIETITPEELSQRLALNGKYLDQWDVLVLGFGNNGSLGEAQSAVSTYIDEGRSVLISYAGAQEETGRLGLDLKVLGQTQDMTYGRLTRDSGEYYRYKGLNSGMFSDALPALQAQQVNEGSISKYPFEVGTAFFSDVTTLMAPEYLLDFSENTKDSDLYVTGWYTLNNNGQEEEGGYQVSPKDARNNYYIYSRGNVVYIGQNEYPYYYEKDAGEQPEQGVDECKLFVNALMAAYNAGVHNPRVSIVAGFAATAPTVESIPIPFDQEFKLEADTDGGILDETVDVYFKFVDNNIAFDKVTTISFYYENGNDPNAPLLLPDGTVNTAAYTAFGSPVWMVENNRLVEVADNFTQGTVYRIKAPVVALKGNDDEVSRIFIVLDTTYKKAGKEQRATGTDSIALTRAQMFLLE